MYGYRARIGYTSPPAATEVFPIEFYMVAPKGVTLALTTLAIVELNKDEIDRSYEISLRAASALASVGINLLVLGGVPINVSRGFTNVEDMVRDTEQKVGVPVTTSTTAQVAAMQALGARKIVIGHPFGVEHDILFADLFKDFKKNYGFELLDSRGAGRRAAELGQITIDTALNFGRTLKKDHPDADTLWLPCPHWATAPAIDVLENELGINVVTANQAITWHALRRCDVNDPIEGYGRLLRQH